MERSGRSGFSPAPLPLPQHQKPGWVVRTRAWAGPCYVQKLVTPCAMALLKPPQPRPGAARLSPGRAHAGGGVPEPGKILAETIPTPRVWPPGHKNKQSYLRTQSCPWLEEMMGIFPGGLAKNSRLCCCLGFFFFNYHYFGKVGNGFFGVGQKEGR